MTAFLDVSAENAVMEHPFAPDGWPKRLEGRDEIWSHIHNYPDFHEVRDLAILETTDRKVIIAEFVVDGAVTPTQQPYEVRYADVVRIRDGKGITWRDYWDPTLTASLVPTGLG
ncbi:MULTISPECIES: nuclear transport factor 2 family protein [Amycolatopsis]|uniref:SnoaL-like domain-containing protein n=2 Tax=Amycolatopsis TaxID=1813 RepID=A0A1I3KBQ1_9PSEU|nr:nuclear transport factor 2 family protein [Amycolatopsis sacchari]SFI69926.1 hypothetical protein SAMN05421835_101493 [Amycolatopsis sacchari]